MFTINAAWTSFDEEERGSLETGKFADLILMDLNTPTNSMAENNVYSDIVFSSDRQNVKCVMVGGDWKVKDGHSLIFDQNEIVSDGKRELGKLIKRIK